VAIVVYILIEMIFLNGSLIANRFWKWHDGLEVNATLFLRTVALCHLP